MKKIEHKDIKTIEDYRKYQSQTYKAWYLKNKDKKREYNQKYYYSRRKNKDEENI